MLPYFGSKGLFFRVKWNSLLYQQVRKFNFVLLLKQFFCHLLKYMKGEFLKEKGKILTIYSKQERLS